LYFNYQRKYKNNPVIAKSELAKTFLQNKGFKNISVAGVGLDIERLKSNEVIKENKNVTNLLYIGQIQDRRNIMFMIDLLENVSKYKNVKLTLIGKGEKEYVDKCFEYAKKINVLDKIEYIEKVSQDEIANYYNNADIFLLPTKYEIFGMVIMEAMYFGLPIITTLNGGSSTIIHNKENGFIEEVDIDKWTDIILKIINKEIIVDKEKIKNTIINNYTWDKLADKFIEIYKG
jgi:glycosyltransferase involved in cell wall biosynthesis